jgi:DNA-3-methyladenine glycosylase II
MSFKRSRKVSPWKPAVRHLRQADPVLAGLIDRVGPCTLSPRRDYFVALCRAILAQQVSTTVARIFFARFRLLFPRQRPTPQAVLLLSDEPLRGVGLSRQKLGYLRDLAGRFAAGQIPTRRFARMSDEEIIQSLLPIKGVGRWTAEMFLIFVLNRPDLLPVDDLGVKKGVQRAYGLKELPDAERMKALAEPWRPWRTVATWYLWRGMAGT